MSKNPAPDRIALTFDLQDLPTAQHRAGLAGLILQIESMGPEGNKRPEKLIPEIDEGKITSSSATITFTRDSMQGVFDDLYAAKPVVFVSPTKWAGKTKPKPGEFFTNKKNPKTGQPIPGFAYDVVQPQAPCLSRYLKEGTKNPWHALWRQMVWSIPRGGNNVRSRAPFIDRADGRPCGEGANSWSQIVDFRQKLAKSQFPTAPISGALMLGAQAVNAEGVPFSGRVDHNLLLHFWQVVVLTFVPQVVSKKDAKVERVGYVLAIPDVADLREFCRDFRAILEGLEARHPDRIPESARIDLPDQACLEVLRRLRGNRNKGDRGPGPVDSTAEAGEFEAGLLRRDPGDRAVRREAQQALVAGKAAQSFGRCVRAVESYHMVKLGNNVKLLSFSRVADRPGLVEDYEHIARNYRSPLFRAALMRALIRDESWHSGMIELFAEYPWPFFIEGDQTPKFLPRFGRDAREQFQAFHGSTHGKEIEAMDTEEQVKHLSLVVQNLINKYIERRAEKKTGIKVSGLKKEIVKNKQGEPLKRKDGENLMLPVYPKEFREAQQRLCTDAFLSMRSRHDHDFVEYFAGSICSVDHQLSQANYQFLVRVLMTNPDPNPVGEKEKRLCWEDVKAIAMIAVSACSFNVRPRDAEAQGSLS